MDKLQLANGVAEKLVTAENTIDAAVADAAALVTEMLDARKAAGTPTTLDAKAHAKVMEALSALTAARTAMAEAHSEMAEVKLRVGLRTRLIATPCEVSGAAEAAPAEGRLRLVNQ